jgi:hypothetical protein
MGLVLTTIGFRDYMMDIKASTMLFSVLIVCNPTETAFMAVSV